MREIPATRQMPCDPPAAYDREAAIRLMAATIVRLFQDREQVTRHDLTEAGFTSDEIDDCFDDACAEASLKIDETSHLALAVDRMTVRKTDIWERAPNVEEKSAPEAAVVAVTVDVRAADPARFNAIASGPCGDPTYHGIAIRDVMRAFVEYDSLLRALLGMVDPAFALKRGAIEACTARHALLAVETVAALSSPDGSAAA